MQGTSKCIRCLNDASIHSGHVRLMCEGRLNEKILAGWCEDKCHDDSFRDGLSDKNGCYGLWEEKYGIKEIEI